MGLNPDEKAIRDLVATWHAATMAGDVETVASLMTDDVVFLHAGGPPMVGKSAFVGGLRELLKGHRIRSSAQVEEVGVSGDLAYSRAKLQVAIEPTSGGGTRSAREGYTMSIFRRQGDGRWLLARDANLLPAPK